MIYEALLVPNEFSPHARDIKRALLTYDKVVLIDPSDRELIPRNAFMLAMGMPPIMGIDMGPVRPQGHVPDYADDFSQVLEGAKDAVKAGLLEVRSTFQQEAKEQLTIGAIPTGGYPLNIPFVFWLYRSMANDQDFLNDAIQADHSDLIGFIPESDTLALDGRGDGGINDSQALPELERAYGDSDVQHSLTEIARGRLAAVVKYAGYCEAKDMVPLFPSKTYAAVIERLLNNAHSVFLEGDNDLFWVKRNRALQLCHEEFMVENQLDSLSFRDVLKLRTRAWGRQASAREGLFESVFNIATEVDNASNFENQVMERIVQYRVQSEDLVKERRKLGFEIKCDFGKGFLGSGITLSGLLAQIGSPTASIGLTLAAGGMWAFDRAKSYGPQLMDLKARESEMRRGAGFGLHEFYSRLK
ncbi:hypothetical protein [Salinisphaera aquimarina]|uniref:Uncharacterized protein n=1 Tax=Salinisphaera aquimarina TaxID=2094031 RepID=A0ABV7EKJ5_9GAMM